MQKVNKSINILGIETSCDETAAAIVADGKIVKSSIVASQTKLHEKYGGVIPEIASRAHIEKIYPVIAEAIAQAHIDCKPARPDRCAAGRRNRCQDPRSGLEQTFDSN